MGAEPPSSPPASVVVGGGGGGGGFTEPASGVLGRGLPFPASPASFAERVETGGGFVPSSGIVGVAVLRVGGGTCSTACKGSPSSVHAATTISSEQTAAPRVHI